MSKNPYKKVYNINRGDCYVWKKIYNDIVSWHESLKIKKRALIIKGLDKLVKQQLLESFVKNITKM